MLSTIALCFVAGVLAANATPHFVKGITKEQFPTPFSPSPLPNQGRRVNTACARSRRVRREQGGAGSADQQAKAELRRIEGDEIAVALGPPARGEVIAQGAQRPLLGLRPDPRPHRHSAAHVLVQVGLGPSPVGLEQAVSAVPRDEHRLRPGADRAGQLGQRQAGRREAQRPRAGSRGSARTDEPSASLVSCVNTTTRRATRRISRSPAIGSCQ